MYCPSCGTEVTKELNYCNRCGANLNSQPNAVEQPVRVVNMNGAIWAVALMVIIGLGIIYAGINDLAKKDIHPAALTWLGIGSFATLFAAIALLMRQLSHIGGQAPAERTMKHKKQERDDARPAQLPPSRMEPVPSVTENTTRTFEPVERRR